MASYSTGRAATCREIGLRTYIIDTTPPFRLHRLDVSVALAIQPVPQSAIQSSLQSTPSRHTPPSARFAGDWVSYGPTPVDERPSDVRSKYKPLQQMRLWMHIPSTSRQGSPTIHRAVATKRDAHAPITPPPLPLYTHQVTVK
ncbi:hypothetical protein ACCO45_009219 [Purpureocillium lilacinum]|uniref:Uncharacterized protein n=1 Tax=Purpureocillium lilacinum TaxID=33203 RepID=A0ACC4DK29_PURLI